MKKRLFIAVDIIPGNKLLGLFENLKYTFRNEKIKWVNTNKLHLTLKFLGDTDVSLIPLINKSLTEVSDFVPFAFKLDGLGYFGSKNNPRVIFAEIDNSNVLKSLSSEINNKLSKLGIEKEEKGFKAHLTLGRIKYLNNTKHFLTEIEKYNDAYIQDINIAEVVLYESRLTSDGPIYTVVKSFQLSGK